ncbi:MAG TPA: glycosyltransferase family 2 protein [Blastocatellia bacterium]|nr:glycosyltransferase family 2 protein [Blastocatellia bacterium]
MKTLSIIIVNWNGRDVLGPCLESITRAAPKVDYEIIVVDNASTDGSLEWLRSDEARACCGGADLRLIENSENLGFGRGNNQAIANSRAPYLFLLNSDTEVKPGAIDALLETLKSADDIGACGPRLLNPDGSLQPSVYRNPPDPLEILVSGLRIYKAIPKRFRGELLLGTYWSYDARRSVRFISGAAFLIKREVVNAVGGFDEEYYFYGEDQEWCLRIVRGGWRLVFEPNAEVIHHGSLSALKRWESFDRYRIHLDASLHFQKLSLPKWHAVSNLLASCFVLILERAWRAARRRAAEDVIIGFELNFQYLKQAIRASSKG